MLSQLVSHLRSIRGLQLRHTLLDTAVAVGHLSESFVHSDTSRVVNLEAQLAVQAPVNRRFASISNADGALVQQAMSRKLELGFAPERFIQRPYHVEAVLTNREVARRRLPTILLLQGVLTHASALSLHVQALNKLARAFLRLVEPALLFEE